MFFLTFLLIIGFALSVSAQSSKLKRAQRYMENLDYTGAIEMYNQVLEKEDNADAEISLALAYMKMNLLYWMAWTLLRLIST